MQREDTCQVAIYMALRIAHRYPGGLNGKARDTWTELLGFRRPLSDYSMVRNAIGNKLLYQIPSQRLDAVAV